MSAERDEKCILLCFSLLHVISSHIYPSIRMADPDSPRGVVPLLHCLEIARGVIVPYCFWGVEIWEIMTVGKDERLTTDRITPQWQSPRMHLASYPLGFTSTSPSRCGPLFTTTYNEEIPVRYCH